MPNPVMTGLLALLFAPGVLQGITNSFPPFGAGMARKGYRDRPNLIPSTGELVGLRVKEEISNPAYLKLMREAGFDEDIAKSLLGNAKNYLSVFDYVTLWRRGDISEVQLTDLLRQMGFNDEGVQHAKDATLYFPTPQDLVRFSVREVYTPETVTKYGLQEDFPPDFLPEAAKAGLPESTARAYWSAHWELPSPTQVYTMLHRGILKEEDVDLYLKSADYMPYWRKKLIALSYDPYTRVDVRRMYALGILSEEQVFTAYKDLGYDDEKASNLVRFTVAETKHTDESTPKANTLAAYKAGVLDRSSAITELTTAGYSLESAGVALDTVDAQLKTELIDLQADAIIDEYQRGGIDLDKVKVEFTRIGVPARMMQLTIERELAQARKRSKHATKTDADAWWSAGFIGDNKYRVLLTGMGYNKEAIDMFLAEVKVKEIDRKENKDPWIPVLRAYSDGPNDILLLRQRLDEMSLGPKTVEALMEVARLVNV